MRLLAFALLIWLAVGPIVVARSWFDLQTSSYRHALWRISDDIVAAIMNGDLPRSRAALDFLDDVERNVEVAGTIKARNVLAYAVLNRPGLSARHHAARPEAKELAPFDERLTAARFRYIVTGSPLGLALFMVAAPLILLRDWRWRRPGPPVDHVPLMERVEQRVEPRLDPDELVKSRTTRALTCVA